MKPIHRSVALLLVLLLMFGNLAAGVFASDEFEPEDTGQDDVTVEIAAEPEEQSDDESSDDEEPSLGTVIDPETGIEHEILSSVEDIIPNEFTDDEIVEGLLDVMSEVAADGTDEEDTFSPEDADEEASTEIEIPENIAEMDFSSRRILVSGANEEPTEGAVVLASYDDVALLQFDTEDAAMAAYAGFSVSWTTDYLTDTKPRTADSYKSIVSNHLKPNLGAVKLCDLDYQKIQRFVNELSKTLSAKSVKNVHGVLHACLQQALVIGLLDKNPAYGIKLPRREKPELFTFSEDQTKRFIQACQTNKFGPLYLVILFTGMREGEALGLTWRCVNFQTGILTIKGQLQWTRDGTGNHYLVSTKNGKARYITVAPFVLDTLKRVKAQQDAWKAVVKESWENDFDLVFTNELGHPLSSQTAYLYYKKIVTDPLRPCFSGRHDLSARRQLSVR